jgi:hypothetical protein
MRRSRLFLALVGLAVAGGMFVAYYNRRARRQQISVPMKGSVSDPVRSSAPTSPPSASAPTVSPQWSSKKVEFWAARYPSLFARLDVFPYQGFHYFDSASAIRHFRKLPFTAQNQDAYDAMAAALGRQIATIPPPCLFEIAAYEVASQQESANLDLGDLQPVTLDALLRLKTALVQGLNDDRLALDSRTAALARMTRVPILFNRRQDEVGIRQFEQEHPPTSDSVANRLSTARSRLWKFRQSLANRVVTTSPCKLSGQ